jgi:hypothetical protein
MEQAEKPAPAAGLPTAAIAPPGQRPPPPRTFNVAAPQRSGQTGTGWIWWLVGSVAVSMLLGILMALILLVWLFW